MKKNILLMITMLFFSACSAGVPEQSYQWHPELKSDFHHLKTLMNNLSMGEVYDMDFRYQTSDWEDFMDKFDQSDREIKISNISQLSCFMNEYKWDDFYVDAKVTFNKINPSFAYASLLKENIDPDMKKERACGASSAIFSTGIYSLYYIKKIDHLKGLSSNCSLHLAWHNTSSRTYITLAGKKKNLYVEFAVPADLTDDEKNKYLYSSSYATGPSVKEFVRDWNNPTLQKVLKAHEDSKLNVCEFYKL